jgi:hypothetical protein
LELFPEMDAPLAELSRVLRPGGILLTSRGTEESGRRAKVKSRATYGALLRKHGFGEFEINPWWKLFDRVIARKDGASEPVGTRTLAAVLRCPQCGESGLTQWRHEAGRLKCQQCGRELSITGRYCAGLAACWRVASRRHFEVENAIRTARNAKAKFKRVFLAFPVKMRMTVFSEPANRDISVHRFLAEDQVSIPSVLLSPLDEFHQDGRVREGGVLARQI